jgi:hypothetical protein
MAASYLQFDCVKRTQIQKVARGFVARQHASRLRHLASIVTIQCHVRRLVAKNVRAARALAATKLLLVVRGFTHKAVFSRKRKAATKFQAVWRGHRIRLPMLFPKLSRANSKLGAENQDLEAQKWELEEEKRELEEVKQQLEQQLEAGMAALQVSESGSAVIKQRLVAEKQGFEAEKQGLEAEKQELVVEQQHLEQQLEAGLIALQVSESGRDVIEQRMVAEKKGFEAEKRGLEAEKRELQQQLLEACTIELRLRGFTALGSTVHA